MDDCDYSKAETKYGEIILDEAYAGEVYVNGLFVDCNSDLKYGYNFKPKYIRLERDRKTCDTWNVEDTTSLMIAEAMVKGDIPMEKVRRMVEERADDVYHFEFNAYKDDVKKVQEMLIESFDTQNPQPYSVPVDSQEDIRKVKAYGGNPVVVPAGVAKLLKEEKDKRIKTLTDTGERCGGYRESAPAEIAIEQTGRMKIRHCMNGTTWTAHVQPWTNTRSRRRRRENNGRS